MSSVLWCVMNGRAFAPPGKRVEHGGFNLDKAFFVKHFTDCGDDFTTLDKYLLDFRICDEVNVALTEAQFGIAKSVELFGKRKQ